MTRIVFISGEAALMDFLDGIHTEADDGLDARNINASYALKRSNSTEVVRNGQQSVSGHLYALDYWKTAGSGSPPGTIVSGDALMKWALDKGLAVDDRRAARIAIHTKRKIKEEGSKQWREDGENVYVRAVEDAEPRIPAVIEAFLRDFKQPIATEFKRAFA